MWSPQDAESLHRNEGWQLGKLQRKIQGSGEVVGVEHVKPTRKWQEMKLDAWVLCRKNETRTDFLLRIIAPVGGMGAVTLSDVCPHCNSFPLKDYIWCESTGHGDTNNRKKKHCNWWCAV